MRKIFNKAMLAGLLIGNAIAFAQIGLNKPDDSEGLKPGYIWDAQGIANFVASKQFELVDENCVSDYKYSNKHQAIIAAGFYIAAIYATFNENPNKLTVKFYYKHVSNPESSGAWEEILSCNSLKK